MKALLGQMGVELTLFLRDKTVILFSLFFPVLTVAFFGYLNRGGRVPVLSKLEGSGLCILRASVLHTAIHAVQSIQRCSMICGLSSRTRMAFVGQICRQHKHPQQRSSVTYNECGTDMPGS